MKKQKFIYPILILLLITSNAYFITKYTEEKTYIPNISEYKVQEALKKIPLNDITAIPASQLKVIAVNRHYPGEKEYYTGDGHLYLSRPPEYIPYITLIFDIYGNGVVIKDNLYLDKTH